MKVERIFVQVNTGKGKENDGGKRITASTNTTVKLHKLKLINKHKLKQKPMTITLVRYQIIFTSVCYLVFLNERPDRFALAPAGTVRFVVRAGVSEASLRHRPLHRLTVVFKLHIARRLEPRLIRLYDLRGVLRGKREQIVLLSDFSS